MKGKWNLAELIAKSLNSEVLPLLYGSITICAASVLQQTYVETLKQIQPTNKQTNPAQLIPAMQWLTIRPSLVYCNKFGFNF